jgi:AraC family transcriptional regulator
MFSKRAHRYANRAILASNVSPPAMPKQSLEVISTILAKAASPAFESTSSRRTRYQGCFVEENTMPPFELEPAEAPFPMVGMVVSPQKAKWNWRENGRDYQADFHPENILTVPKGVFPRQWWTEPVTILSVSFEPNFISEAVFGLEQKSPIELRASPTGTDTVVSHLLWALQHELKTDCPGGRLVGESIGSSLAVAVVRRFSNQPKPLAGRKNGLEERILKAVVEYIEQHLESDLGLEELAKLAFTSRFHFCREFKRSTGLSVHQYVIARRIERSRTLLANTRLSIAEVGFSSGFANQSHFTSAFRRSIGVTPGSFRKIISR